MLSLVIDLFPPINSIALVDVFLKNLLMKTFKSLFLIAFTLVSSLVFGQSFIENKGQVIDFNQNFHPEVKYYYSGNDAGVYFQKDRVVYNLIDVEQIDRDKYEGNQKGLEEAMKKRKATYFRMDLVFLNANPNVSIAKGEKSAGVTHFYLNKRNGIRDVESFKSITYQNIYPNIDIVFHNSNKGMKYDIVLKEGANIKDVQLQFEGVDAQLKNKKLILPTVIGDVTEEIPLSFIDGDTKNKVEVNYNIDKEGNVGFKLKKKIKYSTLTIDPVLEWATYFNQIVDPSSSGAIDYVTNYMDDDGNYYSYGMGYSNAGNYPVIGSGGAYTAPYNASSEVYVFKFNPDRELEWATYLGGSGSDQNYGGRVMAFHGNTMHIVGERISAGAPFTNGGGYFDNTTNSAFWARFNKNTGVLEHLTSVSKGYKPSIAISNSGKVAIICDAYDFNNLPVMNRPGAYNQAINGGYKDIGLMMFNASYNQIWGTFLGGPSSQEGFTCVFDNNENLYFSGGTAWAGISGSNPTSEKLVQLSGAYYQDTPGGSSDVSLGKFNSNGQLVWHTLYGGSGNDARRGQMGIPATVVIHPTTGELLLAFNTTSTDLPIQNLPGAYNKGVPADPNFGAGGSFWNYSGYISKFSTSGVLNWATYFYSNTNLSGTYLENIIFGGCGKFYVGADGDQNTLTGASSGYNLTSSSSSSRNGYITMLNANDFSFEWDSYLNSDHCLDSYVAANINQARFYVASPLWYENLPTVDPGGSSFFDGSSWDATKNSIGILQFHPSLPPEVSDESTCSGESVTLTATGGMGTPYNWYSSNSSSTVLHTGSSYTVNPVVSNVTYYVSSGTGMCASPRVPVSIVIEPSPDITINVLNAATCTNPSTLEITDYDNAITYSISPSGATLNSSGIISGTPGSYTITADNGTCDSITTFDIDPIKPTPTASASYNTPVCEGDDIELTTSGVLGATYSWSGPGGFSNNSQSPTITNAASSNNGTYTVTVTLNGCSNDDDVTVVVNPNPSATASATNTTICEGDDIELTAGGVSGATYSWTGPNGFTSSNQNPTVPNTSSSDAGTYTLTVTNNGCSSNDDVTITINSPLSFTVDSTDPTCGNSDGDITITASGATSTTLYSIDNGANFSTSNTFTGLASGNYQIVVRDDNGCEATQTVNLNNAGAPTIDNIASTQTSCTTDDGTITITASGGTGALQYSIDNGTNFQSSGSFTGLGAGNYDVVVKDDNGCETNGTITINQMNAPSLTLDNSQDVTCNGDSDGSAEVSATGGSMPYAYSWSPNVSTSENGTNLTAGDYTVTVTDAAGCSDAVVFTINEPAAIAIAETITNTGCGQDNGSIALQVTGGNGNYTYTWLPNVSTSSLATGLASGSYDVTVTDGNGCTQTGNYTVGAAGSFALNIVPESSSIKEGESIDLHLEIDPGIIVDSIIWSPTTGLSCSDCTDPIAAPKETTTYYVQVIDDNGCSAMDSITITVTSPCAKIYIPTSFSPNGDGMNDLQCVMGDCIATLDFTIYNRWGEIVFQTADPKECWDGTFRGKLVQTGVYVYKLKATLDNGDKLEESGNINVVR